MPNENVEILKYRDREVLQELQLFLKITANWMAIPLFLIFWFADIIYVPRFKFEFLLIRLMIIPTCLLLNKVSSKVENLKQIQVLSSSYSFILASSINLMILMINNPQNLYYAGLNLVAVGCLSFLPLQFKYFFTSCLGIYMPYFVIMAFQIKTKDDLSVVCVNSFFIFGTIIMCILIRFFNENLRKREIDSKIQLHNTILERDQVIFNKTKEAVRLNVLSNQFSPQVVKAIADGLVNIDSEVRRAKICAIFIDIVGSTERVVRLDERKIDLVLSRFMDTAVSTLLKYDLTIDKFQGDGILAFANEPIQRVDFVQRTSLAALEIMELLIADNSFYLVNWKKQMQVRIGISSGFANVGFYGNKKFFKTYTAIGPPLPMASRLTNLAKPNQILVDSDVAEILLKSHFSIQSIGEHQIKGFEDDQNIVFEIISSPTDSKIKNLRTSVCPNHPNSILVLDLNNKGHYVMKCRVCENEWSM
jgi:class 3 adenylate cyclase